MEERVLDVSRRLARELAQARTGINEDRQRLAEELDAERQKLSGELEARLAEVKAEQTALDLAHDRIKVVRADADDEVLELNVGGHVFTTRRSTLCLYEGSYLANLFSGRWESCIERDGEGRFFLDFDPPSFRVLLNFLRSKRLENPGSPTPLPVVPGYMEERFNNLVEYLGLTDLLRDAEARQQAQAASAREDQPLTATLLHSANAFVSALRSGAAQVVGGASATPAGPQDAATATPAAWRPPVLGASAAAASSTAAAARPVPAPSAGGNTASSPSSRLESAYPSAHRPGDRVNGFARAVDDESEAQPTKMPRWSRKFGHEAAVPDASEPQLVRIADTRALGAAASVRASRGFRSGRHWWQVRVELCSDWSYVGVVSPSWAAYATPIGRASQSWAVASNGAVYANREELGKLKPYSSGSLLTFVVDDGGDASRSMTVTIDGEVFTDVFPRLPLEPLYPAVSNCRSGARYRVSFTQAEMAPA